MEPLIKALNESNLELVKQCLSAKVCIDVIENNTGLDVVSLAVNSKNPSIVKAILQTGANPNKQCMGPGFLGNTSLYWAAALGNLSIVEMLVESGARVDAEQPEDRETCVHRAAAKGLIDILQLLFEKAGGVCVLNKFDFQGKTPLIAAVDNNQTETVKLLIKLGANVDVCDEKVTGDTALKVAVLRKNICIAKLLLESGANPFLPENDTAFDRAMKLKENRNLFELLIAYNKVNH